MASRERQRPEGIILRFPPVAHAPGSPGTEEFYFFGSTGAAAGRATSTAHKVTKAAKVARKEFEALTKRFEELARDVKKASKRVQKQLR